MQSFFGWPLANGQQLSHALLVCFVLVGMRVHEFVQLELWAKLCSSKNQIKPIYCFRSFYCFVFAVALSDCVAAGNSYTYVVVRYCDKRVGYFRLLPGFSLRLLHPASRTKCVVFRE